MRALVTNDDGISSTGLQTLVEILAAQSYQVFVVAPDRERSAIGHAITITQPIWADPVEVAGAVAAWKVTGTPADCVKLALRGLQLEPELVFSGINKGANCGTNIIYSGTVGAAAEGHFENLTSFAISVDDFKDPDYGACRHYLPGIVENLLQADDGLSLYNINFPSKPAADISGQRITRQAVSGYEDNFEKRQCPRLNDYWWLVGNTLRYEHSEDADWHALRQGYISISPLQFDRTNREAFVRMKAQWPQQS